MRLLDRYLLRELCIWLGFVLGGLLICVIAFDIFGSLNHFQELKLQAGDVFDLYVAKIPSLLVMILPVVLLIALLSAITTHARHNELTAIRAAGISLWRICAPYFIVGILLSLAVFAMNEMWVPDTNARVDQILNRRVAKAAVDPNVQINLDFPNARDGRHWLIGSYNLKSGVMINPQVAWREEGAVLQLFARRAERINDVWTFFGSTTFTTNDIINLEVLAGKLNRQTATNGLSQYINSQLSPATLAFLDTYYSGFSPDLQRALAEDLNTIVHFGQFYEPARFAGIALSPDTESLLAQKPTGTTLLELNRLLLLDAYPKELSRNGLNTVSIWKGEASSNYQMHPFLNTNMLAMPQFTETPREFANEAKFNSRFVKLSSNPSEVPIVELRDYAHLHPNLSPERKRWLHTMFQARLALPWACIVVVVIAIPFGAASGRRNIFKGVAGSIVICFVYFILMQVGLALGIGGFVPAWMAAWLPNAFFGITGIWLMLRVR